MVNAIDDDAARFYAAFGFVPLPDMPHRLFLPMRTLASAADSPRRT